MVGRTKSTDPLPVVQHTDSALTSQEAAGQARPVGPPRPHGRRPSSSPPRSFWPWGAIVGDEGALNLSTPTPDTRGTALGRLVGSEAPGWPRSFFGFIGRFSQKSVLIELQQKKHFATRLRLPEVGYRPKCDSPENFWSSLRVKRLYSRWLWMVQGVHVRQGSQPALRLPVAPRSY